MTLTRDISYCGTTVQCTLRSRLISAITRSSSDLGSYLGRSCWIEKKLAMQINLLTLKLWYVFMIAVIAFYGTLLFPERTIFTELTNMWSFSRSYWPQSWTSFHRPSNFRRIFENLFDTCFLFHHFITCKSSNCSFCFIVLHNWIVKYHNFLAECLLSLLVTVDLISNSPVSFQFLWFVHYRVILEQK